MILLANHWLIYAGIALYFTPCLCAQEATSQLRQVLEVSQRRGQLEADSASPFNLTASFEWFTSDGRSTGQGTLETLWRDARHYRVSIKLPTGSLLEVDNGTQLWRTGTWTVPQPVSLGWSAALTPFAALQLESDRLSSQADLSSSNLECVGTEPQISGIASATPVALTTYCLSSGSHLLRRISRPNDISISLNDVQDFGSEYIARSLTVAKRGKTLLHLHVDSLTNPSDFSLLDTAPPPDAQLLIFHRADVTTHNGEIMHGQLLTTKPPTLPTLDPTAAPPEGNVVLKLHIDNRGQVVGVDVVRSSNAILTTAAVAAAKQWRYRVSYQDGRAVQVDETTVSFERHD